MPKFTITFRIMVPLKSDVMAISAMDIGRRIATYNHGVKFAVEPLPAETATLYFEKGN